LRQIVLEELNFTQEIRYQELFRRAAKRSGKDFFTSPRIHFDLSGEEVVVEEFVGGLWLSELLSAVQAGDEALLERARAEDIDLSKVARQLLWVNSWGWSENLFFYTNPQPDNIIVAPGSKLIFTEFSSVSAIDRSMRRALRRNMQSLADNDALNMARASLILLEPLPPISLSEFIKELEGRNWQMLYALANRNDYSDWVDLTTAAQWKGLVEVCAKYGVVIDLNVLRLLRSMMLFESMAVRLDRKLDVVKEYRQFDDFRAFQSRQRIISMVEKQVRKGGTDRNYLVLDRVTSTGDRIFQRIRQVAATPAVSFSTMMSKWSFAFFMLIKFLYQVLLVSVVALGVAFSIQLIAGDGRLNLIAAVQMVVTDRVYLLIVLFLLFVNGRSVLFRMDDTEV
jgi:predicted unusual protein kinase regulating ubiquinone biosynthesis (AarF/ABC1/UbiB family)